MARRKKEVAATAGAQDWETVASGSFPPIWSPTERGEDVIVRPVGFRVVEIKAGKKKQLSHMMDAFLDGGDSKSFFQGGGKSKIQVEPLPGDTVSIPLSAALMGKGKLAELKGKGKKAAPEFTPLLKAAVVKDVAIRIVYQEKVSIGGGQTVKRFAIQAPKGLRKEVG